MDLHTPLLEMLRLVRLYAPQWDRKSVALDQLHSEYDKNKRHLDVALKRISVIGVESDRTRKDKSAIENDVNVILTPPFFSY